MIFIDGILESNIPELLINAVIIADSKVYSDLTFELK